MTNNLGHTTLRRPRRGGNPMRDYDQMPPELRHWLARAILPWRPRSVLKVYERELARTKDRKLALAALDRLQAQRVAKDARGIWGADHPSAFSGTDL